MKRVKLMLLSFSVLAVVAGALAFKAKGSSEYCYATPNTTSPFCVDNGVAKKCPNHTIKGKTTTASIFFCTTPTTGDPSAPCPATLDCGATSVKTTTTE